MFKKIKNFFKREKQTEKIAIDTDTVKEEIMAYYSVLPQSTINTHNISSNLASIINNPSGASMGSFSYTQKQRLVIGNSHDKFIFRINDIDGKEIVSIYNNGSVIWNNKLKLDEAAKEFSTMISLSAEKAIHVTNSIKLKMRDSIFQDIIKIAKEKGPLSAEELTYLLEASKIVEKLKVHE